MTMFHCGTACLFRACHTVNGLVRAGVLQACNSSRENAAAISPRSLDARTRERESCLLASHYTPGLTNRVTMEPDAERWKVTCCDFRPGLLFFLLYFSVLLH
jgi:hypothetical protein